MPNLYSKIRSDTQPGDVRPTMKQKANGKEFGWRSFELKHGYGIFDDGYQYIARIDDMSTFLGDTAAAYQARKDGFKFLSLTQKQKKLFHEAFDCCDTATILDTRKNRGLIKKLEKEA